MSARINESLKQRLRRSAKAFNDRLLRAWARSTPTEQQRLLALTLVVGGVCGLVAVSFHLAITFCSKALIERAMGLSGWHWIVATILTPFVGALIVGAIATRLPNVRGSGIPQVKAVYSLSSTSQRLRLRDAVSKFALSALMIGSGSSLGREGPTVQICASVASAIGRLFALSPSNQRRLIPVGAAAGIAAAFNSPIAAVTFVIEELVGALDTTVLSGVVVAAALAAVVEHSVLGEHPVFAVSRDFGLTHTSSLLIYGAQGVACGLAAYVFTSGLLAVRRSFSASAHIPLALRPAIGGLLTGLTAALVLSGVRVGGIAGGGYDTIGLALGGQLALGTMVALFVAKMFATIMGYSSGGVGGIFAPTLFVGAMIGGIFGHLDLLIPGHADSQIGAFALVGMGAFFAGVVRAPITSILIVFEMTGSYRLVLPLMLANTAAYLVARRLSRDSIYDALLKQDGIQLPMLSGAGRTLTTLSVRAAMTTPVITVLASDSVDQAIATTERQTFSSFPVVLADGSLHGVITEGKLRRLFAEGLGPTRVGEHASLREYIHAGQTLRDALSAMNRLGLRQMVVVDEADRARVAGILSMSDVMRAALVAEPPSTATPMPVSRR